MNQKFLQALLYPKWKVQIGKEIYFNSRPFEVLDVRLFDDFVYIEAMDMSTLEKRVIRVKPGMESEPNGVVVIRPNDRRRGNALGNQLPA